MTKHLVTWILGIALMGVMGCMDHPDALGTEGTVSDKGDVSLDPIKDGKAHEPHPSPKILDLEYDPDKVVKCPAPGEPATVEVCATAQGSDGDSLVFLWDQLSGPALAEGQPEVISSVVMDQMRTECVRYTFPVLDTKKTKFVFKLTVLDERTGDKDEKKVVYDDEKHDDGKKDDDKKDDDKKDDGKKDDGKKDDGKKDDKHDDGKKDDKLRDTRKFPVKVICKPEEEPKVEVCPRTIGFWGTHHHLWPEGFDPDDTLYGTVTWGDVLPPMPDNGACGILGRQYVGALLNQAVGAFVPPIIQGAIDEAALLLGDPDLCPSLHPSDVPEGQQAVELGEILDEFNNGFYESDDCIDLEELL